MRAQIWDIFQGEIVITGPRTQPLVAYVALTLDHQEAVTLLVRNELVGSALALVRPVFEIFWRASWLNLCATDDQAERIRRDDIKFPNATEMVAALDKAYATGTFFKEVHASTWATLNSYTHSGILQLSTRFTDLELRPNYPEEDIFKAVNSTIVTSALTTVMVLKAHDRDADAARIETLLLTMDKAAI